MQHGAATGLRAYLVIKSGVGDSMKEEAYISVLCGFASCIFLLWLDIPCVSGCPLWMQTVAYDCSGAVLSNEGLKEAPCEGAWWQLCTVQL